MKKTALFFVLCILPAFYGCAPAVREISVGLLADPQYADADDRGPRHFRSSAGKLRECISTFNEKTVDFVVCLGDMVDREPSDIDTILPIMKESRAPIFYVLGNHDFRRQADIRSHIRKLDMPSLYYSRRMAGWRFLFLDTNDISKYSAMTDDKRAEFEKMTEAVKAEKSPNLENWNGGIGSVQMEWIAGELEEAADAGEKVIVFGHHQLAPMTNHTLLNAGEMLYLLTSYSCVKAYVNGHYHPGAYVCAGELPCITLEAMVEGNGKNSFAIMTLHEDRIEFKGYGRAASHTLHISKQ